MESAFGTMQGRGLNRTDITKQGDTREAIVAFFYGDPAYRRRLIDDNPDSASLQPGQQ